MNIISLESKKWEIAEQHGLSKDEAHAIVTKAGEDAAKHLPALSNFLNISIYPDGYDFIPETGDSAWTWDDERIELSFDPKIPHGAENLKAHLRSSTFHELNHAARRLVVPFEASPLEYMVSEGTATAFERDYDGSKPLWASYEEDSIMRTWLEEIKALPPERDPNYLFDHPDGRRWIIYKTGTWVVDNVLKSNQVTLGELTTMPAQQVIDLLK